MPGMQNGGLRDMGIARREFLKKALKILGCFMIPIPILSDYSTPVRFTEAVRVKSYPGLAKHVDRTKMAKPGNWAG